MNMKLLKVIAAALALIVGSPASSQIAQDAVTGPTLAAGIASWLATPSSANLAAAMTDKTGSGLAVFGTAPTISSLNASVAMTLAFLTGGGTQCVQVSNTGVVSGTGAACGGSGSTGANPTATAGPTAVNGTSPNFQRADSAPAVQKASNAQFGIMEGDGTTLTCTVGVCSAPPFVTSRTVTGTTDTILAGDLGNIVYYNSASAVAITQPAPSGSFAAGFFTTICQINNGVATVTPGSGTIGGAGTYALPAGGTAAAPLCATYQSDGTNFNVTPYFTRNVTTTIASGTSALGTGAITSATCATAVTTTATGTATTDTIGWGFNGDPTGVTGYAPVTTGALTIFAYPSSNNVIFKVCNLTTASITPGAITLNWRVVR
jgi:hypothetical protein